MKKLKVFIGYDSNQDYSATRPDVLNPPYEVCKQSILDNSSIDIEIYPLVLSDLIKKGIYSRPLDPLATTEFTYSRFLVPYLSNYQGIAIFCDSDFLWKSDIAELLNYTDNRKAVSVCKHDYAPTSSVKMDGLKQTHYPRKNWSSLMVFNCEHSDCQRLTSDVVNTETPKFLHRLSWTEDKNIGEIPITYNWLEGDYKYNENVKVVHFTNGGPWHSTWIGDYGKDWDYIYNKLVR